MKYHKIAYFNVPITGFYLLYSECLSVFSLLFNDCAKIRCFQILKNKNRKVGTKRSILPIYWYFVDNGFICFLCLFSIFPPFVSFVFIGDLSGAAGSVMSCEEGDKEGKDMLLNFEWHLHMLHIVDKYRFNWLHWTGIKNVRLMVEKHDALVSGWVNSAG